MATTIGEQLRLAREERGIALREISNETRISMRYLEAIETNDYKRLPGGVFNRSFVKSYARFVGFDEKQAVEGYSRFMREQGEPVDEAETMPHPRNYAGALATRSRLVTVVVLAMVILAILTLAALAAVHWYQRRSAGDSQVRPPAAGATNQSLARGSSAPANNSVTFNLVSRNYEYFL